MRVSNLFAAVLAFALLFGAFAYLAPPNVAAKSAATSEKIVKNGSAVAVVNFDTARAVVPSTSTNVVNLSAAPPVALPGELRQSITRNFYGYRISANFGKIPIKPLNINAVGRVEPDFVPLS